MTPPREVPSWDEFYLGLAYYYAAKSKDPSTQCGAVVVDRWHVPLGIGFNGPPKQIDDRQVDWSRPAKYAAINHAETNAINHCRVSDLDGLAGCTLYVTGHPCSRCMLSIVSKGIGRIVYGPLNITMVDTDELALSRHVAALGGVSLERFSGNLYWAYERTSEMGLCGLFRKDIWQ